MLHPAQGIKRWICAGDSFTLGFGVDNDDTWCSILTSQQTNIETINMGQGGYGVDQAYLWYKRDGLKFRHDKLIFAFITTDFDRMTTKTFNGHPKPLLKVVDGQIQQTNLPVAKANFLTKYIPRAQVAFSKLSSVRILRFLLKSKQNKKPSISTGNKELALSIFDELEQISKKDNRDVLLVHLPTREDYKNSTYTDLWRELLTAYAKDGGWNYVDLIKGLKSLDYEYVETLFIENDIPGLIYSAGHYTEQGNQYIADQIMKHVTDRQD